MADLTPEIEQTAAEPAAVTDDSGSATAQPLPDLIEADKYLKGQQALAGANANGGKKSGWGKLRMAKVQNPGAS